jgi:hypothetical protein
LLALVRNLHHLNILATYRILETSARTGFCQEGTGRRAG